MRETKAEAESTAKKVKPSRGKRLGGWASGKVRHSYEGGRRKQNIGGSMAEVKKSLRLKKWSPVEFISGFSGRYEDGGRARFIEEVEKQGLSEVEVSSMQTHHRVLTAIFLIACVGSLVLAFVFIRSGHGTLSVIAGISMAPISLLFVAMAARHDFSAWQIRKRRFDGFKPYIDSRFG